MGKTQIVKAKELLNDITRGGVKKIRFEQFIIEIKKTIGSDMNRTVKPYFALMKDTGLIQPIEEEGVKYVIIL